MKPNKMEENIIYRIKKNIFSAENGSVEDFDYKKSWGFYQTFVRNKNCTVKILGLEKEKELSLQFHKKRDELWILITGKIIVYRGDSPKNDSISEKLNSIKNLSEKIISPGDSVFIKRNMMHSASNLSEEGSVILEISFGNADENDIVRVYEKNKTNLDNIPNNISIKELIDYLKIKKNNHY